MPQAPDPAALAGLKVLDMTRVLAGPSATQMLGDLGADVIKVERPGIGDDTRRWGPPYLKGADGQDTGESAYYLSANRNKRSLALDYTTPEGQAVAARLAARADVLVENYRPGTLERHGLGYARLRSDNPGLVYCAITGFGQTGPYAARPGYDFLIQAMGGIMSVTGEPDGAPMKEGVAIADLMAGMYATIAILAALRHRDATGRGQFIDLALLDSQVAWLSNAGQYYLTSGERTPRLGNAHAMIVPYQVVAAADGHFILAVGNDGQFVRFCAVAGKPELAADPRFATNPKRVRHRDALMAVLDPLIAERTCAEWLDALESAGVPCGPINTIDRVFDDPQVRARDMRIAMDHPLAADPIALIGSPLRMSETPATYRHPPPTLGQHTDAVLHDWLDLTGAEIAALRAAGAI